MGINSFKKLFYACTDAFSKLAEIRKCFHRNSSTIFFFLFLSLSCPFVWSQQSLSERNDLVFRIILTHFSDQLKEIPRKMYSTLFNELLHLTLRKNFLSCILNYYTGCFSQNLYDARTILRFVSEFFEALYCSARSFPWFVLETGTICLFPFTVAVQVSNTNQQRKLSTHVNSTSYQKNFAVRVSITSQQHKLAAQVSNTNQQHKLETQINSTSQQYKLAEQVSSTSQQHKFIAQIAT